MGLFSRRSSAPPMLVRPLTPADLDEVRFLLTTNKAIYAIKVVRDRTGMGLKEAKDLVDDIRKGRYVPQAPPQPTAAKASLAARARALKAGGDWHTAAALVMVETGMTESEAGRFVAALEA